MLWAGVSAHPAPCALLRNAGAHGKAGRIRRFERKGKFPAMPAAPIASPAPPVSGQPLSGQIITLFGGGGFIGRHVAQAVMAAGGRVRVVQRHPERAVGVKALGNLGQVQLVGADITRADHCLRAAAGSDAVVNLVGSFANMAAVQGDGAGHVAAAAAATGARALVHLSAIGANADSPSAYGRSKAAGEAAVRTAMPGAAILRPSLVFGAQDQFTNRFAAMLRMAPVVPVVAPATRFQPVYVGDVAEAVVAALVRAQGGAGGATFELGGPQVMTMRAIFAWLAQAIGRDPMFVDVPDAVAGALATLTGWLPGAPITRDQWAMLGRDNVVGDRAAGLAALGIVPTAMASVAHGWLARYRRHGRFTAPRAA